jgi:hypothetical protein
VSSSSLFWLSFADKTRPKGTQFLGACVVAGETMAAAVGEAHRLGINPGGEVLGVSIEAPTARLIPDSWKNRLLSKTECGDFDAEVNRLRAEVSS